MEGDITKKVMKGRSGIRALASFELEECVYECKKRPKE